MSDDDIVETIYGKYHKFEIVRKSNSWSGPKFYIRRDGKPHRGSFSSLSAAVEAAKEEG